MTASMWTPEHDTLPYCMGGCHCKGIKSLQPPFAIIPPSTFLRVLFARFRTMPVGICVHSAARALVRSGMLAGEAWVQFEFRFVPNDVQWDWGHGSLQTTWVLSHQPCPYGPWLVLRGIVLLEQVWVPVPVLGDHILDNHVFDNSRPPHFWKKRAWIHHNQSQVTAFYKGERVN